MFFPLNQASRLTEDELLMVQRPLLVCHLNISVVQVSDCNNLVNSLC